MTDKQTVYYLEFRHRSQPSRDEIVWGNTNARSLDCSLL